MHDHEINSFHIQETASIPRECLRVLFDVVAAKEIGHRIKQ